MIKLFGCLILLSGCNAVKSDLHYNDCVEITGGFYYSQNQQLVGRIIDQRKTFNITEYKVGNVLFGIWILDDNLKKINSKICEEFEHK